MPSVLCSLQSKVATGLSEKTSCILINNLYSLWLNASAVEYQYILDLQIIYQFWIIGKTHMTWIISLDPSYWGPSAFNCWWLELSEVTSACLQQMGLLKIINPVEVLPCWLLPPFLLMMKRKLNNVAKWKFNGKRENIKFYETSESSAWCATSYLPRFHCTCQ